MYFDITNRLNQINLKIWKKFSIFRFPDFPEKGNLGKCLNDNPDRDTQLYGASKYFDLASLSKNLKALSNILL